MNEIVKQEQPILFTEDEVQILIANKIIPASATPLQIKYFFEVCKRKHLDPFLKQMHMIERRESDKKGGWRTSYTIQASLDGMRAIVQRNCKVISYKRWTERRNIGTDKEELYGCCEINTADRGLCYDEVPFNEYCQKTKDGYITHFWKQFPETMIKKCAEESVDRMVCPEDLSGVYGDDEMMQAEKPATETLRLPADTAFGNLLDDAHKNESIASLKQIKALYAVNSSGAKLFHNQLIWVAEDRIGHELIPDTEGKKHLSSLTSGECSIVIEALKDGEYMKTLKKGKEKSAKKKEPSDWVSPVEEEINKQTSKINDGALNQDELPF